MLPHVTIEPRRDRETAAGGFRVSYHDSPLRGEPGPGMARDTEPSAVTRRQRQQAGLPQEGGGRWPLSDTGGEPGPAAADPGPGHKDERAEVRGQRPGPRPGRGGGAWGRSPGARPKGRPSRVARTATWPGPPAAPRLAAPGGHDPHRDRLPACSRLRAGPLARP